jgi:hypothetical protein
MERVIPQYDDRQRQSIALRGQSVVLDIMANSHDGISEIHPNQESCSIEVVNAFSDRHIINVLVVALTQSGKTGAMLAVIKNYIQDINTCIPVENIYIITALSSKDWVEQTRNRMPEHIQRRVHHRDRLDDKFIQEVSGKQNVLVLIDEIQVAARPEQTMYRTFQRLGFYDKQYLLDNDIKIVEFSATPDGTVYDIMNWGENAYKTRMHPGIGYIGCHDLLIADRVKQFRNLYCGNRSGDIDQKIADENIGEVKIIVRRYDNPKYHIIRTPSGKTEAVIENFRRVFGRRITYRVYDRESDVKDINDVLQYAPVKHTFIFIKEMLRCSKTLCKKHLGVVYERHVQKPDDAVIIQGLVGRGTGYDDNGESVYFTNISSIERYHTLFESNFEDREVVWKSKTTKKIRGMLESRGTFNNPDLVDGLSISSGGSTSSGGSENSHVVMRFNTYDEMVAFYNSDLKPSILGRGPQRKYHMSECGKFYMNYIRGEWKVMGCEEVERNAHWGISTKRRTRYHVCYRDITNPETLQHWLIYKE